MPSPQLNQIFECCKKGNAQQLLDELAEIGDTPVLDERGHTPMCIALKYGQWQIYKALIDNNYIFDSIRPLLISACQCPKDETEGIDLVLENHADINLQNPQKRTALMTACLLGHINKTQKLIDKGAAYHLQDNDGNTALIEAVQSKNKQIVELILQQKPDINQANKHNETALIVAVKQKLPIEGIINLLLEAGSDPEKLENNNKSAWLIAKQKHIKIAKLIEKHLNSINQIELPLFSNDYNNKETKQMHPESLSNNSNKLEPADNTVEKVEDITIRNSNDIKNESQAIIKNSPIYPSKPFLLNKNKTTQTSKQEWFHAAKTGNLGKLNRMIVEGIDIDCKDGKGCTALIRACGHSRRAVVSYLLQQKADIEMRSDNGSTALSSSIIGNCRRVAGLLLDNGANPNGLGPEDYSYTTIAAAQWNEAMLSILYRNGSDIFITNKQQQNLIHITALAAEFYNNVNKAKSTIQFFLDHAMDINAQDENGNTALMILCGAHRKDYKVDDRNIAAIVHSIIKLGAAPVITNKSGQSAIDAAKTHKLHQTKSVLMNALSWNDSLK